MPVRIRSDAARTPSIRPSAAPLTLTPIRLPWTRAKDAVSGMELVARVAGDGVGSLTLPSVSAAPRRRRPRLGRAALPETSVPMSLPLMVLPRLPVL